jgi:hypothetical protein
VFAEGRYGALYGTCGFEPLADPITLSLRPAGGVFEKIIMPGSALWAAAIAASIQTDDWVDQRRNALVDF